MTKKKAINVGELEMERRFSPSVRRGPAGCSRAYVNQNKFHFSLLSSAYYLFSLFSTFISIPDPTRAF